MFAYIVELRNRKSSNKKEEEKLVNCRNEDQGKKKRKMQSLIGSFLAVQ